MYSHVSLKNKYIKNLFVGVLIFFSFANTHAQSTVAGIDQNSVNEYNNTTLLDQARKQCESVIKTWGTSAIFNDNGQRAYIPPNYPVGRPGNGNVQSQDRGVFSQLNATNNILGDIFRVVLERNFGDDCFKQLALANAATSVKEDLLKTQAKLAEDGSQDPQSVKEKSRDKILKDEAEKIRKSDDPQKEAKLAAISKVINPEVKKQEYKYTSEDINEVANGNYGNRSYWSVWEDVGKGNNYEDAKVNTIFSISKKVSRSNGEIDKDSISSGGLAASRYCTETISGADPQSVAWDNADCRKFIKDPIIINTEKVKQLVNAPYTQAFSESASLGLDGGLANINKRINLGKLFEKGLNSNFGKGELPISGLASASSTKNALIGNATGTVSLGIEIQKAVAIIYASPTSSCRFLSVVDRASVISEVNSKKIELETYKIDLERKWAEVLAAPNANYTNFFLKLSIDLSQKYSKQWLTSLFTDAQTKIGRCSTAANGT
jgi:hypothetical protein